MTAGIRTLVVLAIGAMAPVWAAAKPDGGLCACTPYMEAPALCGAQTGAERQACIKANLSWFDSCVAWREQMCHAPLLPTRLKLIVPATSLQGFVGAWTGKTVCPKLGGWRILVKVAAQHDGSFIIRGSTEGAGEFTEIAVKNGQLTLVYSSLFRDSAYTGRLTSPDRVEGSVRLGTDLCSWYLAR